jgi:hypothetical protein
MHSWAWQSVANGEWEYSRTAVGRHLSQLQLCLVAQWSSCTVPAGTPQKGICAFMPLCRFLLANRLAPEALRPLGRASCCLAIH